MVGTDYYSDWDTEHMSDIDAKPKTKVSCFPEYNPSLSCSCCEWHGAKIIEIENGSFKLCKECYVQLQTHMCYSKLE